MQTQEAGNLLISLKEAKLVTRDSCEIHTGSIRVNTIERAGHVDPLWQLKLHFPLHIAHTKSCDLALLKVFCEILKDVLTT